ncbi:hypothetical protein [Mesobacillus sp. S13]|uniref:hypothetical protein n=1 Tax=Mesobacillus sp. S13 TaxID=2880221 RepID=UPI001CF55938|nr:hypothetical protein [Mesobacillus sp. S13]
MKHVIDELQKSLKYHKRQLEDNQNKIQLNEESVKSLKEKNLDHESAINEIESHLNQIRNS